MAKLVLERFARSMLRYPEGQAVSLATGETVSFRELDARSNRIANALLDHGVVTGDRVAILGDNSIEYVEAFLGILKAGGCAVPLPTLIAPDALRLMIAEAAPRAIFFSHGYREVVRASVDPEPIRTGPLLIGFNSAGDGAVELARFREAGRVGDPGLPIQRGDLFNIIYSSGTTGRPKGIVHTHGFRAQFVDDVDELEIFEPGTMLVAATPFYSNATIGPLFATLGLGSEMVVFSKFSVDAFFELCSARRPRHVLLVPVQIGRVLDDPRTATGVLGYGMTVYSTGSTLSRRRKEQLIYEWGASLVESYGMTEGGPGTTLRADRATPPEKLESVGRPALGCEIRIIDEHGAPVPTGQVGEIVGRSRMQMVGYYQRPAATEEQLWRDESGREFVRSGDIGRLDQDGYVYILDRKKEMIISGGFNIYASDLEAVLLGHADVLEAAVVGVPSDEWGETPVAVVVPRPGRSLEGSELLAWANERLGKVQRISGVHLREFLPRGGLGKVLKARLRAEVTGET